MELIIVSKGAMHESLTVFCYYSVVDPNSEIRRRGRGAGAVSKKNFPALRVSVWSKNKGAGAGHRGPSPGSTTAILSALSVKTSVYHKLYLKIQAEFDTCRCLIFH